MRSYQIILLIFFSLLAQVAIGQEICDNGIDDDGDGLIDLNDDDCICSSFISTSLIPNPSFEEMTCCPTRNAQLNCAVDWIQASQPTTDYVHTCQGYLGNTNIPAFAPLPFPDGEGAVGFRDGQKNVGAKYKEYVGACLTEKMKIGTKYRLDFFVGFRNNIRGSKKINLGVFATTNCSLLPFGNGSTTIGCPVNTGSFVLLAEREVSGSNQWVNVVIEFEAKEEFEVVVLGPACADNPDFLFSPYFYIDRFDLGESGRFGFPFDSITGAICSDDLELYVTDNPDHSFQWYKDGVAIVGETQHRIALLDGPDVEGTYIVTITTDEGCRISKEFILVVPSDEEEVEATICENDLYIVNGDTFLETGKFDIYLKNKHGCDSLVHLDLTVDTISYSSILDSFCKGETYSNNGVTTDLPGEYKITTKNAKGCDSVVTLSLTELDLSLGVNYTTEYEIELGELLDIYPNFIGSEYTDIKWCDESGLVISNESYIEQYFTSKNTTLTVKINTNSGCQLVVFIHITVKKINKKLFVPNVFSPNGDNINDGFRYFGNKALDYIEFIEIYNRWGGLVYRTDRVDDHSGFRGWDGKFNGEDAQVGVYCYVLSAVFLDGSKDAFSGDVTLLR